MTALLEVQDLEAGYGRVPVLHGLSLAMQGGSNIGLFGPNGHGKTTFLRVLSGLLRARAGSIRFEGQDITRASPRVIVDLGLIQVPQGNRLFPDLTIEETLRLGAHRPRARRAEAESLARVLALFPKLAERRRQKVRTLSGGERQMVSIGIALMSAPRLLLLDEPTLGLAPRLKEELAASIRRISEAGLPLVVVEQDVEFLLELAPHLYLINHGEVAAEIKPGQKLEHGEIIAMYFGG